MGISSKSRVFQPPRILQDALGCSGMLWDALGYSGMLEIASEKQEEDEEEEEEEAAVAMLIN